jgi:hypothetical protein
MAAANVAMADPPAPAPAPAAPAAASAAPPAEADFYAVHAAAYDIIETDPAVLRRNHVTTI